MAVIDLGLFMPPKRDNKFEQLTDVRNFVRKQLKLHDGVNGAKLDVSWNDGEVDGLVFGSNVGYPDGTNEHMWIESWKKEIEHGR